MRGRLGPRLASEEQSAGADGSACYSERLLSKWPPDNTEHCECQQVDTQQGLNTRDGATPTGRTKDIFPWLQPSNPITYIHVPVADAEGANDAEP
jgi:hypothetical protein